MVSSCSMGTQSSSSDDGPLTPDSDHDHDSHGIPGYGYFTSQKKAEVEDDQDEHGLFFTIGRKSTTSSTRASYRIFKAVKGERIAVRQGGATETMTSETRAVVEIKEKVVEGADVEGEKVAEEEVKLVKVDVEQLKVEEIKAKEVQAEEVKAEEKVRLEKVTIKEVEVTVIEGAKPVERPSQSLPPPEWTGGLEWRKLRYLDPETSESKVTFDIHAWGAASKYHQHTRE